MILLIQKRQASLQSNHKNDHVLCIHPKVYGSFHLYMHDDF